MPSRHESLNQSDISLCLDLGKRQSMELPDEIRGMPLSALHPDTRKSLSVSLNSRSETFRRGYDHVMDYAGLAELYGKSFQFITQLERSPDPMAALLKSLTGPDSMTSVLWLKLADLGRLDVLEKCREPFCRDAARWHSRRPRDAFEAEEIKNERKRFDIQNFFSEPLRQDISICNTHDSGATESVSRVVDQSRSGLPEVSSIPPEVDQQRDSSATQNVAAKPPRSSGLKKLFSKFKKRDSETKSKPSKKVVYHRQQSNASIQLTADACKTNPSHNSPQPTMVACEEELLNSNGHSLPVKYKRGQSNSSSRSTSSRHGSEQSNSSSQSASSRHGSEQSNSSSQSMWSRQGSKQSNSSSQSKSSTYQRGQSSTSSGSWDMSDTCSPCVAENEQIHRILTTDDMDGNGNCEWRMYSAYINCSDEDVPLAKEMMENLEAPPYGLQLFLPQRQLLIGGSTYDDMATVVEDRCRGKVIIILSRNYITSGDCQFVTNFARALDPASKMKQVIPVFYEDVPHTEVPKILIGVNSISKKNCKRIERFWQKLNDAILAT